MGFWNGEKIEIIMKVNEIVFVVDIGVLFLWIDNKCLFIEWFCVEVVGFFID